MTLTRRIHPEAALELLEAAQWYEVARTDLGDEFLSEVGVTERHVLDWPEVAGVFHGAQLASQLVAFTDVEVADGCSTVRAATDGLLRHALGDFGGEVAGVARRPPVLPSLT